MSDSKEQLISEKDVADLAEKLEKWGATLPPAERALLTLIMSRAKSTDFTEPTASSAPTEHLGTGAAAVGLSASQTRAWLTPWTVNRNLSFKPGSVAASDAFVKDTGPSWVDSPRRVARLGSIILEEKA
jgi:hypothetical protein